MAAVGRVPGKKGLYFGKDCACLPFAFSRVVAKALDPRSERVDVATATRNGL